jgi:hypothetical protein
MNTYEIAVADYNNKIKTIVADESKTKAERFVAQVQVKLAYESIIAKALLETLQVA